MTLRDLMSVVLIGATDEITIYMVGERMKVNVPRELHLLNIFMDRKVIGIYGYNAEGYDGLAINLE